MTQPTAWDGIQDNISDIGDGLSFVENVSFMIDGELGRRPGLGASVTLRNGKPVAMNESGNFVICATTASEIDSLNQTAGTMANLKTSYNVFTTPCLAPAFQRMYICNDFDKMQVSDDGATIRNVGIDAPTVDPIVTPAAGGSLGVGAHLVRYRYQDQTRNRLSNPSNAITGTTVVGTQSLNITPSASADANVTHIIIEVTAAGASAYYRAATIVNASTLTNVSPSDAALIQLVSAARDGEFQHLPPPTSVMVAEHRQRVWWWGNAPRSYGVSTIFGNPVISINVGTEGASQQWVGRQVRFTSGTSTVYTILSVNAGGNQITLTANSAESSGNYTVTITTGTPDLLGWSRAGFPESFDATNYARRVTLDAGDVPTAMFSYYTDLYLCGARSMRRMVFTSDPATAMVLTVPGVQGAFHQRCVCAAEAGLVFGWGRDGMWRINAMAPEKISTPVEQTLVDLADSTKTASRFVVYEPSERVALFFFVSLVHTTEDGLGCRLALAYHIDQEKWSLWRYRQPFRAGCQNSAYVDRQRLMLSDGNGWSWRVFRGYNDGLSTAGVFTATGGSTTVVNAVTTAVAGQILYRPATSEERLITVVGASTLTLSAALATAMTNGETLYVGSIRQRWVTDWRMAARPANRQRPPRLNLMTRPNNSSGQLMGTAVVKFYRDFSNTPSAMGAGNFTDTNFSGISFGDSQANVDLDAAQTDGNGSFVSVPTIGEWDRALQVKIIAEAPYSGVRLYLLELDMDGPLLEAGAKEG